MSKPLVRAALIGALLVFAAGCEKQADTAQTAAPATVAATPDGALLASVKLLKQGDFGGLMQNALPPDEFARLKADWGKGKDEEPVTDEDRQKFLDTMTRLTAPDAEQKLYADIEPQLKQFDAQYQAQIPMYVAMGSSWIENVIKQNKDLSDAEKQQAVAALGATGAWVTKTRFTDPEAVKKVVAIASKVAREMNLKTLDEARALDYDQSMQKARVAFVGLKDALGVYGFSVDQLVDSVKSEVVSNDGKLAKLKISYTLFDTPLAMETEMVNLDGRWYGKQTIDRLKEKAAMQPTAPTADAPAAPAAPTAQAEPAKG